MAGDLNGGRADEAQEEAVDNADLLMPSRAERKARQGKNRTLAKFKEEHPAFGFACDLPQLRKSFLKIDDRANDLKARNKAFGYIAVTIGFLSLLIVAASPLYHDVDGLEWLARLSVILGIVAFCTAALSIFVLKERWLSARYCTERMRQFFFQNLLYRLPDLLTAIGDKTAEARFAENSRANLRDLALVHIVTTDAYSETIDEASELKAEVLSPAPSTLGTLDEHQQQYIDEFFDIYSELRIGYQAKYAATQLTPKGVTRRSNKWINHVAVGAVLSAVTLHAFIVAGLMTAGLDETWGRIVDVVLLGLALTGLWVKAIEEGRQTRRELDRYEGYYEDCVRADEQFKAAKSSAVRRCI